MSLCIPPEALDQHVIGLGKTRSGKSSVLRYLVEDLLRRKKRVCIVDPKGDWWGLKSSANGRSAGFPVTAFGDFKNPKAADVPITPEAAKHVVELITSGNRPCIIGLRGWMPSQLTKFWIEFASALFNANLGEFYLVVDECHNFAPKGKVLSPAAGECLHWSNRLASEGLGLGLHLLLASQRPQKVHNDTLTSCETLIALRVIHAADRGAIKDWIDGCGDGVHGNEVLGGLAQLARGEAYVWSPEIKFGPKRVQFPLFSTFDSFAEPKMRAVENPSTWADVNLEEVKEKLASVIKEASAHDPAVLKGRIKELELELRQATRTAPVPLPPATKEVSVLTEDDRALLKQLAEEGSRLREASGIFQQKLDAATGMLRKAVAAVSTSASVLPVIRGRIMHVPNSNRCGSRIYSEPRAGSPDVPSAGADLGKCERSILTVLEQYPQGRTTSQLALLTGYSGTSGSFNNALGKLRTVGYITRGANVQVTPAGTGIVPSEPLPSGQALVDRWLAKLGKCERAILEQLTSIYPDPLSVEELGAATGYAPTSGSFNNALGKLRTLELIERGRPVRAIIHAGYGTPD